jgi:hypothetical protein
MHRTISAVHDEGLNCTTVQSHSVDCGEADGTASALKDKIAEEHPAAKRIVDGVKADRLSHFMV